MMVAVMVLKVAKRVVMVVRSDGDVGTYVVSVVLFVEMAG